MNGTLTTFEALPKSRGCIEAFISLVPLLGLPGVRSPSLQSWTWRNSNDPEIGRYVNAALKSKLI